MTDINALLKRINEAPTSVKDIDWEEETGIFNKERLENIILGIEQDELCIALSKLITCLWYKAVGTVKWEEYRQNDEWIFDIPDNDNYYVWTINEYGEHYYKPLFNDTKKEENVPVHGVYIEDVLEDFIQKRERRSRLDEELNDIMRQFDTCNFVPDSKIHEKQTEESFKTTTEAIGESNNKDDAVFKETAEEQSNDSSYEINTNKPQNSVKNCFCHSNDYVRQQVKAIIDAFYLNKPVNLALIEVALFDHGQLHQRNSHKKFVQALIDWSILSDDIDIKKTTNGMTAKFRKLPPEGYKQWDNNHFNDRVSCTNIGKKLPESMKYNR